MTSPPTSVYTISCIVLLAMVMEYVLGLVELYTTFNNEMHDYNFLTCRYGLYALPCVVQWPMTLQICTHIMCNIHTVKIYNVFAWLSLTLIVSHFLGASLNR